MNIGEHDKPIDPSQWSNLKIITDLKSQYADLTYRVSNLERLIVKMMAMKEKDRE